MGEGVGRKIDLDIESKGGLMELRIDDNAKAAYPSLKVAVAEAAFSGRPEFNREITDLKRKLEDTIRNSYRNPDHLTRITKYNSFYKKFGSKVPMEFQIRSIINNKEIPAAHPVLTCMFIAELKNMILTAGHDLDKLVDSIEVSLSTGAEEYARINEALQKLKPGDIFAADGTGIISSVLYGPDSRTKITAGTERFLFMCYSFGLDNEEIEGHMNDILGYLRILGRNSAGNKPVRIV